MEPYALHHLYKMLIAWDSTVMLGYAHDTLAFSRLHPDCWVHSMPASELLGLPPI